MHVDDAAELCVRAAVRDPAHSMILNAGYPGGVSIPCVITDLAARFGLPAPAAGDAPWFEMDLSRLEREIGLADRDLPSRLDELAEWARRQAAA